MRQDDLHEPQEVGTPQYVVIHTKHYSDSMQTVGFDYFSDNNGFDDEDRSYIAEMEKGQHYELDMNNVHVIRISDKPLPELVPAEFVWDFGLIGKPEGIFKGYHNPKMRWNGWACPCFEKEQVDRIMTFLKNDPDTDIEMIWTGKIVRFRENHADEYEDYTANFVTVNGQQKEVWYIGAFMWTWDTVKNKEIP